MICIPSQVTEVEKKAVIDAATTAGARRVYLIEEPIAAAIGAGIDISKACGNMVVDIGGGPADIAVTGSVNQKGIIQPIGGVNEKIEGFYAICKNRGLTGEQGVIIPIQNVRNLHLSDNVIESVKQGKFHIYAVSTIDEGIVKYIKRKHNMMIGERTAEDLKVNIRMCIPKNSRSKNGS